jgi:uncharacterized membrane protein HdeD (DUF308 family)
MKLYNRILHILIAIILICVALLLLILGEDGKSLIALIMGGALLIYGIRCLAAYFLKFRYTVGGRMQLYIGIIVMDLGLLIISSYNGSGFLVATYLLGFRMVMGAIDLARALEARKNGAPWKIKLTAGIISLATVLLCIILRDPEAIVDVFCLGLVLSAVEHIITAFRKNKIVTIA